MFLYTNYQPEDFDALRSRRYSSTGQSYSDYKMDAPLQVEYISMRPKDPLEYFTMASVTPEHIYHVALTKEEIGSLLARTSLHRHSYYELSFVLSGNLYFNIENRRHLYTPGSCCLLNRNVMHAEEHETDFDVMFLGISDDVLRDVYRDLTDGFFTVEKTRPDTDADRFLRENLFAESTSYDKEYVEFIPSCPERADAPASRPGSPVKTTTTSPCIAPRPDDASVSEASQAEDSADAADSFASRPDEPVFRRNPGALRVRSLFRSIQDELLHPRIGSTHRIKAMIAGLLHTLSDPAWYQTTPLRIGTDAENLLYDRIDRIMHETNGRASRSFLEEELHYSGDYLNKITKKYTGLSIHDYGMTICMGIAAQELLASDRSIGDITASLGFSNRTHFYKQFSRVYHLSPAEYRKNYRKEGKQL